MIVKMGSSSPRIGVKIPKIFETLHLVFVCNSWTSHFLLLTGKRKPVTFKASDQPPFKPRFHSGSLGFPGPAKTREVPNLNLKDVSHHFSWVNMVKNGNKTWTLMKMYSLIENGWKWKFSSAMLNSPVPCWFTGVYWCRIHLVWIEKISGYQSPGVF